MADRMNKDLEKRKELEAELQQKRAEMPKECTFQPAVNELDPEMQKRLEARGPILSMHTHTHTHTYTHTHAHTHTHACARDRPHL